MESNGVNPMKRSLDLYGTKTSISVEDVFWTTLDEIARERKTTRYNLIVSIEEKRRMGRNLSSAVRVYVLSYVLAREAARAAGCRCQTGGDIEAGERSGVTP